IVQESLTNVLRYGRSLGRVDVHVTRDGDLVTIDVLDDGRGTRDASADPAGGMASLGGLGSGQGIAGMRERAGIYAGTVTAWPGK
ncbi:ATP-binding protein, partial [Paraburkholderia sp. SIMBA_030]|uniref:ATP-binding protein n=1 Tax=Paraburkholderia sp. SIMBA_030 TaxID=3085773 RepID=UPI00397E36C2